MQTVEQTKHISKTLMLTPIVEVFDQVTPNTSPQPKKLSKFVKESLDGMFPEQEFADKQVKKARAILGDLASEFTPSQLKDVVAEIQFLADSWLDDCEREVFNGLTLKELLHERGGK